MAKTPKKPPNAGDIEEPAAPNRGDAPARENRGDSPRTQRDLGTRNPSPRASAPTAGDTTSDTDAANPAGSKGAPMQEIGVAGLRESRGVLLEEFLPALSGQKAVKVYRQMSDNDTIIGAILFAIANILRATKWTAEPSDESKSAKDEALFAESLLDDMSHTWEDFIAEALSFLVYGWSYFEIVLKRRVGPDETSPEKRSKHDDGRVGIRKLAIRAQETLSRWELQDDGGVQGMWQYPLSYSMHSEKSLVNTEIFLPIEKCLLFRTTSRKNSPEGVSLLRNAYRSWWYTNNIEDFEAIGIERELAGLPVISIPSSYFAPDAPAEKKAVLGYYTALARDLKRNEQGGIVIPSDPWRDADDKISSMKQVTVELLTSGGARQIQPDQTIMRHQRNIARSVLADFIMLGNEGRGSFALSKNKTDLFLKACETFLNSIAGVLNRFLLPRVWAWNGLDYAVMPTLKPGRVAPVDLAELGAFLKDLTQSGVALFPDDELENFVRDMADIPEKSEEAIAMQEQMRQDQMAMMGMAGMPGDPNAPPGGAAPPFGGKPGAKKPGEPGEDPAAGGKPPFGKPAADASNPFAGAKPAAKPGKPAGAAPTAPDEAPEDPKKKPKAGNPFAKALDRMLAVAFLSKFDPDQPRDEGGRWTAAGGGSATGEGSMFASPNIKEGLSFAQAREALASPRQQAVRAAIRNIDHQLGLAASTTNVIGAWRDGAENSTMTVVQGAKWDEIKAVAAMQGYLANQKQVLAFQHDGTRDAYLASFYTTGDMDKLYGSLLESGIEFHTFEPNGPSSATIYVYGEDQATLDSFAKFASTNGGSIKVRFGHGEFIGTQKQDGTDAEQRADARAAYQSIIDATPRIGGSATGPAWDGIRSQYQSSIDALKRFEREVAKAFDPDQPRDEAGRWTAGGGAGGPMPGGNVKEIEDMMGFDLSAEDEERLSQMLHRDRNEAAFFQSMLDDVNFDYGRAMQHAGIDNQRTPMTMEQINRLTIITDDKGNRRVGLRDDDGTVKPVRMPRNTQPPSGKKPSAAGVPAYSVDYPEQTGAAGGGDLPHYVLDPDEFPEDTKKAFEVYKFLLMLKYNPDQPRDERGRWVASGGGSYSAKVGRWVKSTGAKLMSGSLLATAASFGIATATEAATGIAGLIATNLIPVTGMIDSFVIGGAAALALKYAMRAVGIDSKTAKKWLTGALKDTKRKRTRSARKADEVEIDEDAEIDALIDALIAALEGVSEDEIEAAQEPDDRELFKVARRSSATIGFRGMPVAMLKAMKVGEIISSSSALAVSLNSRDIVGHVMKINIPQGARAITKDGEIVLAPGVDLKVTYASDKMAIATVL